MTWKTRKERQDEKSNVAPNGNEPAAKPIENENDVSEPIAKPFVFDLTGNAFKPVSARIAQAVEPEPDILASDSAPRFMDVPDDDAQRQELTPEPPAPVSSSPAPAEMATLSSEDDFVAMPIPATVLSSAEIIPSENSDDTALDEKVSDEKDAEPLVMPTLSEPLTMETPDSAPTPSAEEETSSLATFATAEEDDAVPGFDDAALVPNVTPDISDVTTPDFSMDETPQEPEIMSDVNPEHVESDREDFDADDEMPALGVMQDAVPPAIREPVAPALIYTNAEDGIPRVAPFIVDVPPPAPIVQAAAPTLVVKFGKFTADFLLSRDVTTMGRPDSTTQTYPDIEIELDDTVSRRHAEVVKRGNEFFIVDVGSANGTKLNGEILEPYQEVKISRGDRIHLGERTEIIVQ